MNKLIQPCTYNEDTDVITMIGSMHRDDVVSVTQPVTGWGKYTHLVQLGENSAHSFGLAKLSDFEVNRLPTSKQYNADQDDILVAAYTA